MNIPGRRRSASEALSEREEYVKQKPKWSVVTSTQVLSFPPRKDLIGSARSPAPVEAGNANKPVPARTAQCPVPETHTGVSSSVITPPSALTVAGREQVSSAAPNALTTLRKQAPSSGE